MNILAELLAYACLVSGAFFVIVGAVGVIRMPEFYTRLHAASVTETLGSILVIAGLVLLAGFSLVSVKLLMVLLFILFTSCTAVHALAKAAIHGAMMPETDDDD